MRVDRSEKVLSIPVGTSSEVVERYAVYACPADRPRYANTQYVAFRRTGGEMRTLYRVEEILEFNHHDGEQLLRLNRRYRERVLDFLLDSIPLWEGGLDPGSHRVWVLSQTDQIPLEHHPRLKPNLQAWCYLDLADLTDPTKLFVKVPPRTP